MLRWITRSERGQAMVETAIVLPVVVLLVFAMLDAGRVFNAALGGGMTYDVTLDNVQGPSGTPVTVEVGTDVTIVTPLISAFFSGSSVRIDNTAVMQLE
jgi:hypothetical protein